TRTGSLPYSFSRLAEVSPAVACFGFLSRYHRKIPAPKTFRLSIPIPLTSANNLHAEISTLVAPTPEIPPHNEGKTRGMYRVRFRMPPFQAMRSRPLLPRSSVDPPATAH